MIKLVLLLSFISSLSIAAVTTKSFLPPNDLWIGTDQVVRGGITRGPFKSLMKKIGRVYGPIVKERGGRLNLKGKWSNGTVNAYAQRAGRDYKIYRVRIFGGLARHPAMTIDGLAVVVCHEIGHHIGGYPRRSWATNEGQSDYWATLKCFRRVFFDDDNIQVMSSVDIPEVVNSKCSSNFSTPNEVALCNRSAMAALSLAKVLQQLNNIPKEPDFNTPDPKIVTRTSFKHPPAQCRLDTYFSGAICDVDYREEVSYRLPNKGVCARVDGYETGRGSRPRCWYKPKK